MATRAEIVDSYFRNLNAYPHVPFRPIGEIMVREVERMGSGGLYLSTAAALVEQESGGKRVMGCDFGPRWTDVPPYCNVEATSARVKALIKNYHTPPVGGANGISYCQLTSMEYVEEAERLGGAHFAWANMRVGFRVLNDHIKNLGWPAGAAAYNAGAGNWRSVMHTYGASMQRREREWAERLRGASDAPKRPAAGTYTGPLALPGFRPVAPRSGDYMARHPTRYEWREDVEALIRRLYARFGRDKLHINTYVGHPEVSPRDTVSLDIWGPKGRNDWQWQAGREAFWHVFNDPNPPYIEWCILDRRIWYRSTGRWHPFGDGTRFTNHEDHGHITLAGPWRNLS